MSKHSIAHIDIPAQDREASARFYHELFGWKFEHFGPPSNCTTFETGNIGGGYAQIDGKTYQGNDVIIYVDSDDVDADLKRAEALGAKRLLGKTDVPGYGQYAIFVDPAGNRMALWKSARSG